MQEQEIIDAVILWVDGNDPKWQAEKAKYQADSHQDGSASRYREWGLLKYIFRGIEKYAPWIRKVHFVTCGHYPEWLNLECPKLHFVKHEDFIPKEYLPTFSSRAIDLNLHRIEGLAEKFIYFNDDMFLTDYVKPEDFFRNDLPCDIFSERPISAGNGIFNHSMLNDMQVLSKYFDRKAVLKENKWKILYPKYGEIFFYNILWYLMPFKNFCGLYYKHLPMSYRKSTWVKLWQLEADVLTETISHKFRSITDVNQFIFNYWQLMSGEFYPMNMKEQGKYFSVTDDDIANLCKAIESNKYKRLCINDVCSQETFEKVKGRVIKSFEQVFVEKSIFER